ncbi:MAG: CinA family nicotinamide mononucleotide deamidase-related protein [Planctomycetota bacterium]|jgi:nicotinamide-nucleotide amidase|nr:CinA family nicotinamide mononucleotide deamidase-related protein [Planctomycetota bacterium]MDR1520116.1 CinA family nicotinamide mononucleotide deamidase-related protein [Planctomycetota bacterium]
MRQPTVYLLSCGDELLFGHTVDTNSAWLAEQCTLQGWRLVGHRTIGDITPDIVSALLEASALAEAVILTGGLGPTRDDRTRQALAHALGVELREDPEALAEIQAIFKRYNRPMAEANRVQALIPAGAGRIVNPNGTAPGIRAVLRDAKIFCLPGVPREMREMFKQSILPVLKGAEGAAQEVMRRLHLCGRGESDIGAAIRHLMGERSNPEVGTAVAESIVTVRLYAKGDTRTEAERTAAEAEADIRKALGHDVYGVDDETLAGCVVKLLAERSASLVVGESCTGGLLSSLIVDVPGASSVFRQGIVAYANAAKTDLLGVPAGIIGKHGAVSRETVSAMAENHLRRTNFPLPAYSIATTGIAGPDGGTPEKPVGTVWIACSRLDPDGGGITRSFRLNTVTDRRGVRMRAANAALDLARRTILGYPSNYQVEESNWKKD